MEWEVNEITIEDKYEIVLTATYETDVPAAVVAIEPSSVSLPAMQAGDVFNGEFTLTNYGLIRADDLKVHPAARRSVSVSSCRAVCRTALPPKNASPFLTG